jgi:hypothetical protein
VICETTASWRGKGSGLAKKTILLCDSCSRQLDSAGCSFSVDLTVTLKDQQEVDFCLECCRSLLAAEVNAKPVLVREIWLKGLRPIRSEGHTNYEKD